MGRRRAGRGLAASRGGATRGRATLRAAAALAGIAVASLVACFLTILPALDPVKSVRPLTARYRELAAPGEGYAFYSGQEAALQLYTRQLGIELEGRDELATYLSAPRERWLFVERELLADLGPAPSARLVATSEDPDGYVLFEIEGF